MVGRIAVYVGELEHRWHECFGQQAAERVLKLFVAPTHEQRLQFFFESAVVERWKEVEHDVDLAVAKQLANVAAHVEHGRAAQAEVRKEELAFLHVLLLPVLKGREFDVLERYPTE